MSPRLTALLLLPGVNALLIVALCFLPTANNEATTTLRYLRRLLPGDSSESVLYAAIMSVIVMFAPLCLSLVLVPNPVYGFALFCGTPFLAGFLAVLLSSRIRTPTIPQVVNLALISQHTLAAMFLLIAIEGVMCLVMAAVIAIPLALLGAFLAFGLVRVFAWSPSLNNGVQCVGLLVVALMVEPQLDLEPPVFETTTTMEIAASPQQVWKKVVTFSEITEPPEWVFATGISYPIRARIEGEGVGAVRHCEFSTGAFIEPITVWTPP